MRYIRRLDQVTRADIGLVGGKNAGLGELVRGLGQAGVRVPPGFAITADAYRRLLGTGGLADSLERLMAGLDPDRVEVLQDRGARARELILQTPIPSDVAGEILAAYSGLGRAGEPAPDVAVRSSATAEDLPGASFAGQQESYLNVRGPMEVLAACQRCFASLYTDRAISYRIHHGFAHEQVALAICVQRMVRADLGAAGVAFTIDPETGFADAVVINAAYGLGEAVVQGAVDPDEYIVFKPTLRSGHRPILRRTAGSKEIRIVYDEGGGRRVRIDPVAPADRTRFALEDDEILEVARLCLRIEDHFAEGQGSRPGMDIEWAKDGRDGQIYILQARPETVHSQRAAEAMEEIHVLQGKGRVLARGRAVGDRIGHGPVRIVAHAGELTRFRPGEVLVASRTDPDWEPAMKLAAAIVTDHGGRTCHAAIISRELGLPAVVGTGDATRVLASGAPVTVSAAEGDVGHVYEGLLPHVIERRAPAPLLPTRTRVLVNLGNPAEAFRLARLPCDGVGLARLEFIIASAIRIHPMALLRPEEIADPAAQAEIDRLTGGWSDRADFFVDRLAEGVAMIAAAFHPREVVVRFSDFKTNEYAELVGGRAFEPVEENPMIGFRGACRYSDPRYRDAFALECRALHKVRTVMGLDNVALMIPFCRTVAEGERVLAEMAAHGLERGREGLRVLVMCEIPSNVVCAAEFARIFDGFSIGSNDLTQLVLGTDRDSELLAHLFDERDPAVQRMIAAVIRDAHAAGRPVGICGQGPSDHPELLDALVRLGIDSISLSPDRVIQARARVAEAEGRLQAARAEARDGC
jgi:pyruvate,water dikinase